MVPQIARNVMINIDALIPPRPKRSAAQMSRGIGVYKSAGEVPAPRAFVEDEDSDRHRARTDENRFQHASGRQASGVLTNRWCAPSRNAGTRTTAVTAFEIPRLRHSIQ